MATPRKRKYKRLTNAQWAELEPILKKERTGPGAEPAKPRKVFNTLLCMLWEEQSTREVHRRGYASPPVITRMLSQWLRDGNLEAAWRTYLKGLSKRDITRWRKIFNTYTESWKDREQAQRYAGRVHSLWFRQMHDILRRVRR